MKSVTGDTHLFRTLVDLDDPIHMKLRGLTQSWFMPPNLKKLEGESKPSQPSSSGGGGKKFIVRQIDIRDVKVHVDLLPIGGQLSKVDVPILVYQGPLSRDLMKRTPTEAIACAEAGMMLRTVPADATVQFNFTPVAGSERSRICMI